MRAFLAAAETAVPLCMLLLVPVQARAREYHVKTDGTGDFATMQACANVVRAGDSCLVHAGSYDERVSFSSTASGTAGARVTFKAVPRRQVEMRGFFTANASYLRIEGFNIKNQAGKQTWGNAYGIHVESDYVEVVDNYFYDTPTSAIFIGKSWTTGTHVANNHIYKCQIGIDGSARNTRDSLIEGNDIERLYMWQNDMPLRDSDDTDYIRFGGVNTVIRNNHLHGTVHKEIVYRVKDGSGNVIPCTSGQNVHDPWCLPEGPAGAYVKVDHGHCDGIELLSYVTPGGTLDNALVEDNVIEDAHTGIKSEMRVVPVGGVTIRNNVIQNMWNSGISVFGVKNYSVYNNTFFNIYNEGVSFREFVSTYTDCSGVAKNNIFAGVRYRAFYVEEAVAPRFSEKNNLVFGAQLIIQDCSTCPTDPTTLSLFGLDPRFTNASQTTVWPIEMRAANEIVLEGTALESVIHPGSYLEYINDGIVRTVSGTSIVDGNLVVMVSPGVSDYERVDRFLKVGLERPYFAVWSTIDFALRLTPKQGSPAIDAGADMSGVVDRDKNGNTRPRGVGWDIGAFEIPLLTPPGSLRILSGRH